MNSDILEKIRRYCAYQDRCHQEVRYKLIEWEVYGDELEEIMVQLINEKFLNEERYARSYARGKFRIKKWGRVKIRIDLHRKGISEYNIKKGLSEIDDEEYSKTLLALAEQYLQKKVRSENRVFPWNNLYNYLYSKGFENELIKETIRELSFDWSSSQENSR